MYYNSLKCNRKKTKYPMIQIYAVW